MGSQSTSTLKVKYTWLPPKPSVPTLKFSKSDELPELCKSTKSTKVQSTIMLCVYCSSILIIVLISYVYLTFRICPVTVGAELREARRAELKIFLPPILHYGWLTFRKYLVSRSGRPRSGADADWRTRCQEFDAIAKNFLVDLKNF